MNIEGKKPIFIVKTCAASGNLGPGLDILGLALDINNTYEVFYSSDSKYHIVFSDGNNPGLETGSDNLIVKVIKRVYKRTVGSVSTKNERRTKEIPLKILADINIPLKSGLSSSSSAIVAGLLIANHIYGFGLEKEELLNIGLEFEGHPDGIAAALFGGLIITYIEDNICKVKPFSIKHEYEIGLFISKHEIDTKIARKLIPKKISMYDCIYNMRNTVLLLDALKENDLDSARLFIKDRLHQPYRKAMYEDSLELVELLINEYKIPAAISGAGPSVICIINNMNLNRLKSLIENLGNIAPNYRYIKTAICYEGSKLS